MNIVAMIPARSGSKGIKGKNLRCIAGKPLISYTIDAALASRLVSRVLVSTDSAEMRALAVRLGAEAPFIRPPELANDTACMVDVMRHCVRYLERQLHYRTEMLVTLYPTSPFRTGMQIDEAITQFLDSDADCLVSVSRQKHHPYWTLDVDPEGKLFHYFGKDKLYYRRQDMPVTYEQNGAIYIVPPANVTKLDRRSMTDNTLSYIMEGPSALNIDDEHDLLLANAIAAGMEDRAAFHRTCSQG
jgi:CMP-N,N'-diacetyllegionaminic acid synthase